jgi:hypothetical protein
MEEENVQLELGFPDPDEFPSFDDVDPDEAQSQVPSDDFDQASVTENESGCLPNE